MHLLIIHYHWRPGGVRQVVESWIRTMATPPHRGLESLVLAAGEPPPPDWARAVEAGVDGAFSLRWEHHPLLAYAAEWPGGPADCRARLTTAATSLLLTLPEPRGVILENPTVGRHPLLARVFADAAAATGDRLLCHHHDFFLDGRWERWPEWRACGVRSFDEAWEAALPADPHVTHATITHRDAAWLAPQRPTLFCPNPLPPARRPPASERSTARTWLRRQTESQGPVWLCPTRVLRRKNLLEAALLARLLAPDAVIATTGAASSPAEMPYAHALSRGLEIGGPGLRIGLLASAESAHDRAPSLPALMAAADLVVIPSLFEGFGLPAVEAAALGAHTLARTQACPDGVSPQAVHGYTELRVPWEVADGQVERTRQHRAWQQWRLLMPAEAAAALPEPPWWIASDCLPFSRLSLAGQLAVLQAARSPDTAGEIRCLNPWLDSVAAPPPPASTSPSLSSLTPASLEDWIWPSMERRAAPSPTTPTAPDLKSRLPWANHYPLLWPDRASPSPFDPDP